MPGVLIGQVFTTGVLGAGSGLVSVAGMAAPARPLAFAAALVNLWNGVWPYLLIVLAFSVIIFVHELGHFAVAKWAGVRVERFAIGFGREIFGFTWGETRYSFNFLPLGGYVKMLGQEDFDDKSQELKFGDDPRSFINKPVGPRMAIVSAGVIMNVLFAFVLFVIVFMIGMRSGTTKIGFVVPDSPADRAGLLPGDDIREINGHRIREFQEVQAGVMLAPAFETIEMVVERDGERESLHIQPETNPEAGRLTIGISPGVTREIVFVGPEIDQSRPDRPRVGDRLAEINGQPVTDENINQVRQMLGAVQGDVIVERKDPAHPDAPPQRIPVEIPPILQLYPSDPNDEESASFLGLTPLARVSGVDPDGRAALAGLEEADTVLAWDDVEYPTQGDIIRSVRYNPDHDIYFTVRKSDGRIVRGFVRPKTQRRGVATIQAAFAPIDTSTEQARKDGPKSVFRQVRPGGVADEAGIRPGDVILELGGERHPSPTAVARAIRTAAGQGIELTIGAANGAARRVHVIPQRPGEVGATFRLLADDYLRVGRIVEKIQGAATPAAAAGIPSGAMIVEVNGEPVGAWHEFILRCAAGAGSSVQVTCELPKGERHLAELAVPRSIRTVLGVGPEARIVRIDGQERVELPPGDGRRDTIGVGHHRGTTAMLRSLVGERNVPVEFRRTPISLLETAYVDVSEDMTDAWLGRVELIPNVEVGPETIMLRATGVVDAISIGTHKTWYFVLQVYQMMKRMIFDRTVGVENVSGPLGIVALGGNVARAGFVELLFFMAIISANLAVINFLPLPIVDGGLMVFLIIEKIKGSPVSLRVQVATQMIGLFLIIGAFIFVTFNDALKLLG
jgi:membrane-associated protease RseP (regulator of RpoE activity)